MLNNEKENEKFILGWYASNRKYITCKYSL